MGEVTGKPVRVAETADVANWGACILAGLGAGLYSDPLAGELHDRLTPNCEPSVTAAAEYEEIYHAYVAAEARQLAEN